jgi:fructosamine-3-kinase
VLPENLLFELRRGLYRLTRIDAEPVPDGCVNGGDVNQALRIRHAGQRYFLKLNRADRLGMFEAERDGLLELAGAGALRVPAPLLCGTTDRRAWLLMEHLDLDLEGNAAALGTGLAALHRHLGTAHGWYRDNTIGLTAQVNTPNADWCDFWSRERLGRQLELAVRNGHRRALQDPGMNLIERLPALFSDYKPQPSLLHGDLWCGNFGYISNGLPVVFDPAVYYGDRETDMALTRLFGGFSADFYAAYEAAWPLDAGYAVREVLYQLYHVLNHLNLFGASYLARAEQLTRRLLSELK